MEGEEREGKGFPNDRGKVGMETEKRQTGINQQMHS